MKVTEIQDSIIKGLVAKKLYPFSVFYTFLGEFGGTLAVTFFTDLDMEEFLDLLDYKHLCDKSGFFVFPENNTVIVSKNESILKLWSIL